jgi:peptide/nickel transport system permease protein
MIKESITARQAIKQAHQALRAGDREAAYRLAEQAKQLDPNLEDPWLILAAFSSPEQSVEFLKRALQINPNSLRAREGMHWAIQRLRIQQSITHPPLRQSNTLVEAQTAIAVSESAAESDSQVLLKNQAVADITRPRPTSTFRRVFTYVVVKAFTLFFTVAVGLYLFILILNLGGYVDRVFSAAIDEYIGAMLQGGWLDNTPEPERSQIIEQTRWQMQEARGLHKPFAIRSFQWFVNGITLQLGEGIGYYFRYTDYGPIREIILQRLPYTLILAGVANVFVFFSSILTALLLARKPGSLLDRLFFFLSPLTSVPSWILGIILIAIFAAWLRILPFPRLLSIDQVDFSLRGLAVTGRLMILPMLAIFIGAFFQGVYSWRTFFLINAGEDYVEMARVIGYPRSVIERRYIVRPVLPYIITSFATMMLLIWQGSLALELLFYWPGIGLLFLNSVRNYNTPTSLGIVVVFAYLLTITIFLLDIVYALVDPRVRVGGEGYSVRPIRQPIMRRVREMITGIFHREKVITRPYKPSQGMPGNGLLRSLKGIPGSIKHWFQDAKLTLRELFRSTTTRIGLY